jgi:starch synthase
MRVLHVAMECVPFSKVGGMADVVGSLPKALRKHGVECTVLTPWYPQIHKGDVGEEVGAFDVWIAESKHPVRLMQGGAGGAILLDQPTAFDRPGVYDDPRTGEGFKDSLFRCLLLQQAARIALRTGLLAADVVHCHDNHTGILPAYLKEDGGPKSVFTIHNLAYQGRYAGKEFWLTGFHTDRFFGHSGFEFHGDLSLMKSGLTHADVVTTVSPTYAAEIVRPEHGQGLDGVLRGLGPRLVGILNGIDAETWDPGTDVHIAARYTASRLKGKEKCRAALRERCGLANEPKAPILGMVSRLTHQKGIDLVGSILPWIVRRGAQLVLLGSGDQNLLDLFRGAQGQWPDRVALLEGYDEALSHQVYAGSDLFLMPSRFEPCGLAQLYALRYGAPVVAVKTGGLCDTVHPFGDDHPEGTGVLAHWASADSFQGALDYALGLWDQPAKFQRMRKNAMRQDHSWDRSAKAYADLYRRLVPE